MQQTKTALMKTYLFLFGLMISFGAFGEVNRWIGNNHLFNQSDNWSLNRIPNTLDTVIIENIDSILMETEQILFNLTLTNTRLYHSEVLQIKSGLIAKNSSIIGIKKITSSSPIQLLLDSCLIQSKLELQTNQLNLKHSHFKEPVIIYSYQSSNQFSEGGNQFSSTLQWFNHGEGKIRLSHTFGNTYNDTCHFQNNNGYFEIAYRDTSYFNAPSTVSSVNSLGFRLCSHPEGSAISEAPVYIDNYNSGQLFIQNFQFNTTNPIEINLSDSASIYLKKCSIKPNLSISSPRIKLAGNQFDSDVELIKTDKGNDYSPGGNTFAKKLSITHQGSDLFQFESDSNSIFQDSLLIDNKGIYSWIDLFYQGTHDSLPPISLTSSNQAKAIRLGYHGQIKLHSSIHLKLNEFTIGHLWINNARITGNDITTEIPEQAEITFNQCEIFPSIQFTGNQFNLKNSIFHDKVFLTKTGNNGLSISGGNTFEAKVEITNNSEGYLRLQTIDDDHFQDNTLFRRLGSGNFLLGQQGDLVFEKDIQLISHLPFRIGSTNSKVYFNQDVSTINSNQPIWLYNGHFENGNSVISINKDLNITNNGSLNIGNRIIDLNGRQFTNFNVSTTSIQFQSGGFANKAAFRQILANNDSLYNFPFIDANDNQTIITVRPQNNHIDEITMQYYLPEEQMDPSIQIEKIIELEMKNEHPIAFSINHEGNTDSYQLLKANANSWVAFSNNQTYNSNTNTLNVLGLALSGKYGIGVTENVLPIIDIDLKIEVDFNKHRLQWNQILENQILLHSTNLTAWDTINLDPFQNNYTYFTSSTETHYYQITQFNQHFSSQIVSGTSAMESKISCIGGKLQFHGYLNNSPFALYDINGKLIFEGLSNSSYYWPSLDHGVYLVKINNQVHRVFISD